MKSLNILFIGILFLILALVSVIAVIGAFDTENSSGLDEITGTVQSYEVYHGTAHPKFIHIRKSERYDDKYLEYLDHIQKSRDTTFFR